MKPILICIGTVLLLLPAIILAYADEDLDDSGDESSQFRARRGWSMMRLGRGLQMLRLGKRGTTTDTGSPSTPEQMRAMLSALVDEGRSEYRRQPPLPRYGRELDLAVNPMTSPEDAYTWMGQLAFNRGFALRPVHYNRRYKRSTDGARGGTGGDGYASSSAYPSYDLGYYYPGSLDTLSSSQARAVALPRIGRYLGAGRFQHPRLSTKAVPVPRIGREDDATAPEDDLTKYQQEQEAQHHAEAL